MRLMNVKHLMAAERDSYQKIFTLQAKARANLFATSCHISNIEREFEGSTLLEIHASEEDMRRYLDGHVL